MGFVKMQKRVLAFALAFLICSVSLCSEKDIAVQNDIVCSSVDVSEYAERLKEISKEQEKLDKQIKDAEKNIKDQSEKQKLVKEKIDTVNEKITTLNSYMTQLEIKISSNERKLNDKKKEVDKGVYNFKKRLRAMYLSGDNSYTTVLLESGDFYDMLMRMELIKRVAKYDNQMIEKLMDSQKEYEQIQTDLQKQKDDYDKNLADLTEQKKELDKLYNSSKKLKEEYEKKKTRLEEENEKYVEERNNFEADIASLLSTGSGDVNQSNAEQLASDLIKNDGVNLSFGWPVPGVYNVTSGVGERWGTRHNGMDIAGPQGSTICAAESGKVLIASATCPHNYGKDSSCGCGHGYGNYVLIDHGNGFATLYGHMTSVNVSVGETVKKGQAIGAMGSTGYSTGNHLHFEVRFQGIYVNPASFLNI